MPKDRRDRSVSIDRSWTSPYICNSSHSRRSLTKSPLETESVKEWEEARCPVCMEHPHNAILLLCSSHEKGCRPFMCDTSYRHSNCFDQFQKASSEMQQLMDQQETTPVISTETAQTAHSGTLEGGSTTPALKLVCPLCRGEVNGWIVVEAARLFMNSKSRSCASETCDFSGTYMDLRKHARLVHPLVRPSEADPDRQRDWRRLERQRDIGDLLSSLQSSIGDERGEDNNNRDNSTSALSFDEGGWMTVFFLIRVFRPRTSSRSSSWSGTSRARAHVTIRRRPSTRLWGETHNDEPRDDDNESSDGGSGPPDLLPNDES
ncbi:putative transcription factor C2H2 family [Helianthus debilis subsp. tardiflorus]